MKAKVFLAVRGGGLKVRAVPYADGGVMIDAEVEVLVRHYTLIPRSRRSVIADSKTAAPCHTPIKRLVCRVISGFKIRDAVLYEDFKDSRPLYRSRIQWSRYSYTDLKFAVLHHIIDVCHKWALQGSLRCTGCGVWHRWALQGSLQCTGCGV